jgi:predicted RND superfamily exporter protein
MSIEMMVLGSLHFIGLQFNMMSSIMLIVGVGLCVDFSAHTTHAFLHSRETTPQGKARDALRYVRCSPPRPFCVLIFLSRSLAGTWG